MKIEASYHLDEWIITEIDEYICYERGKIKILENLKNKKLTLQIKSTDSHFFTVKEIEDYFELIQYDVSLNRNLYNDEQYTEYLNEYMMYLRDTFEVPEYIVFNKETGQMYGVNGLFNDEGWGDEVLEEMWSAGRVDVIELLDDTYPSRMTKNGWEPIKLKAPFGTRYENRETNLNELYGG